MHGMGLALIPPLLIRRELEEGRLIVPIRHTFMNDKAYYLIVPERKAESAALRAFRDWLAEEARRYRTEARLD